MIRALIITSLTVIILLFSTVAGAAGVRVADATDEQVEAATAEYLKGKEAFEGKRFDDALKGFRASYDIVASPNARYMTIASLSELGKHVEAYKDVDDAIAHAKEEAKSDAKYLATVNDLERTKKELLAKIGTLTVLVNAKVDASATLTIDGEQVDRSKWGSPILVNAGSHTVALTGHDDQTIEVAGGADASATFDAPPVVEPEPIVDVDTDEPDGFKEYRPIIGYSLGGVGVVGMIMFGAFGSLALSKQSDLDDTCDDAKLCPVASQEDIDDGKTFQTVANVGLIVGIVGLAAGLSLIIWDVVDDAPSEEGEGDDLARLRLTINPGGVGITGSF